VLAAHRKDTGSSSKNRKGSGRDFLRDKEKEIRDKLVLKLKKKAESNVVNQKGKVSKAKSTGEGLESVSDEDLSDALENNKGMEDISDDEIETDSSESVTSDIDSEEELRLTSTDDDSDKESKPSKSKKKDKKEKKRSSREKDRDRSRRKERKQRELKKQISLAERIASKRSPVRRDDRRADLWEHEKYDRTRPERERTPTGYYGAKDYYERRQRGGEGSHVAEMDEYERDEYERKKFIGQSRLRKVNRFLTQQGMRKEQVESEMERAYEKYFSSLARKEGGGGVRNRNEDIKEEQWERMTNPHLFGGSGGGGFRKVKAGQHYEEVQKEALQHEIRIRERREKMSSDRDRDGHRYRERGSRREKW